MVSFATRRDIAHLQLSSIADDPNLANPRGSIVRHENGYEYPSHANQPPSVNTYGASTPAFGPNVSVISTPAMHTEVAHVYSNGQGLQPTVGGGYLNGTNMDIYANQTTSIVANGGSFTAQAVDGPLPPIMHGTAQPSPRSTNAPIAQVSLYSQDQGSGYTSNPPVRTEGNHSSGAIINRAGHEQQYIPKEEEAGKEDQPRSHLSPIVSDASEIALSRYALTSTRRLSNAAVCLP